MLKKLTSNKDGSPSITNWIVLIFTGITAFKSLFGGVVIDLKYFDWHIESLDMASTLPMLFGLLNYGHKRTTLANANTTPTDKDVPQ